MQVRVRVDATNVLNYPGMNAPRLNITNLTAFGKITGKANNVLQFPQLRISFYCGLRRKFPNRTDAVRELC